MELMPLIIGGWGVFFTGYTLLSIFTSSKPNKCNCKAEMMKIKKNEKQFNKSINN